MLFGSYDAASHAVAQLAAVGAAVSSLELLADRKSLRAGGLLSWDVARNQFRWQVRPSIAVTLDVLLRYPMFISVLVLRLVAAILLLSGWPSGASSTLLIHVLAVSSLLIHVRCLGGLDGSDQMSLIVFWALALGAICPPDSAGRLASLWFIGLQACLAYTVAGIAKLFSSSWRNGSAIVGILGTRMYGSEWAAVWLRSRPQIAVLASWGMMIYEAAFPVVLVGGSRAVVMILGMGVAFHLLNAFVLGLNTFFWSFVSTYPAILYCANVVAHSLRRP